ncbi:MAG: ATP-dependent zinc metalloprotease FtsH [Trueperaceae bacterium]|nr:ATP-dependent zinc metalloprotease FtsH [Trueperaceae bacterium]
MVLLVDPFGRQVDEVPYSTFRQQLRDGNVGAVTWRGQRLEGTFTDPVTLSPDGRAGPAGSAADGLEGEEGSAGAQDGAADAEGRTVDAFLTYVPAGGDPELLRLMNEHDVRVDTQPARDGFLAPLLIGLLPLLLLLGIGAWFLRRMQAQGGPGGGMFQVGQSQAKLYDTEDVDVTFDEVAGTEGAKDELQDTISFLRDPDHFLGLGGRTPSGLLLLGPPGTGKTMLARAVAGEAGVPFFSTSGSDFMEMFVGVGASRVRDMFRDAKERAPAIIFIDELDSIGRQRGAGLGGGHDEREQTLNQLLKEMDGFEPHEKVVVMAATNRPDVLDPALLRPGRFDRRITIDLPNKEARLAILRIHARDKPLEDDVDLEALARGTPGLAGADLENVLNEAALEAARQGKDTIGAADVAAARDKVLLGRQREGVTFTDEERALIAYHEAGHAVLAATLPHAEPVEKVSIVPRGQSMGVTQQLPQREKYVYERSYLIDRLAVVMGGRAAETLALETETSGAAADFQDATRLARRMVREFGMSERLGPVSFKRQEGQVFLGEELAARRDTSERTEREIDEEIHRLLSEAMDRARTTLEAHRAALDQVAEALQQEEELDGARVRAIVSEHAPPA